MARAVAAAAAVVVVAAGGLTGCAPVSRPQLAVVSAGFDEPLVVRGSGFRPGSLVDLSVAATDGAGVAWSSHAAFVTRSDGVVDPSTRAPSSGDYLGVVAGGLTSAIQPRAGTAAESFSWPSSGAATFTVQAGVDGRVAATAAVERAMWTRAPAIRQFNVYADGFAGTYVRPSGPATRGPAVLFLGGTGGGEPRYAADYFAARGIPALSVAYFGVPDLSPSLTGIPLEYFARPLTWLRSRPEIDPDRVWIAGVSAGSEAAALVAADRPDLVHGLLALAPSSVAHCAFAAGCPTPAWLRAGRPVPATGQYDLTTPTDDPGAVIEVERIRGPVLAVCGEADLVWDSCGYAAAMLQRRHGRAADRRDLLLSYPDAGHGLILLAPFVPRLAAPPDARMSGSTTTANDEALADAWPKILRRIRDS